MASPDVTALGRSDLNHFLFAEIGTEANGVGLSVLSVFARIGADPWNEAGRLAALPRADARESLARTIAGMPKSAWSLPDAASIAARLIELLPSRPVLALPSVAAAWPLNRIALAGAAIALVLGFAFMLSLQ